jgi:hypothetical protein
MYKPVSESTIRNLSPNQRDLLVDHIDHAVDVVLSNQHLFNARNALMKLGLLKGTETIRPRTTVLTERGRMAVGMILGECADALVRAGLLEQENPLQVLAQLKRDRVFVKNPPHLFAESYPVASED